MLALTLLALLVSGQTGVCKPGVSCQVHRVTHTAPTGTYAARFMSGAKIGFDGQSGENYYLTCSGSLCTFSNMNLTAGGTLTATSTLNAYTSIFIKSTGVIAADSAARVPLKTNDAEGFQILGVATAALPALDGGFAGTLQYVTDTGRMSLVKDDNTRVMLATTADDTRHGAWTGVCFGVCPERDTVTNIWPGAFNSTDKAGTFGRVACSWGTAGTGGAAADGGLQRVVVEVVDDSPDTVCSCSLGICETAAGQQLTCDCATAFVAAKSYSLALTALTDCSANPQNIVCNVEMTE